MADIEDLLRKLLAGLGSGSAKSKPEADSVDPFAEITAANKHLRETAKWILTSFAAVGAIVVGGLQLSSIGKLTDETPDARIAAALVGLLLAAIGVALAIGYMSTVLEPFLNTFRTADKHPDITQRVLGDREILRRTYPELKAKIEEKDAAVDEARKLGTDSPQYKQARAEREAWERNKRAALVHIGAELLWERYKTARVAALFAMFLVFAGVVTFAWGAKPARRSKGGSTGGLGAGATPARRDPDLKGSGGPQGQAQMREGRPQRPLDRRGGETGGADDPSRRLPLRALRPDTGARDRDCRPVTSDQREGKPMASSWLFHTYRDKADEWRWQLKADNGKIVADSGEGYTSLSDVRRAAPNVKENAGDAEVD